MATDPNDIRLTRLQRKQLADLADAFGLNWRRLVDHFLAATSKQADEQILWNRLQQESLNEVWDNHQDAVFDDL